MYYNPVPSMHKGYVFGRVCLSVCVYVCFCVFDQKICLQVYCLSIFTKRKHNACSFTLYVNQRCLLDLLSSTENAILQVSIDAIRSPGVYRALWKHCTQ